MSRSFMWRDYKFSPWLWPIHKPSGPDNLTFQGEGRIKGSRSPKRSLSAKKLMSQFWSWVQCWKPHVATTPRYKDICQKPFHKIRQQTVESLLDSLNNNLLFIWSSLICSRLERNNDPCSLGISPMQMKLYLFLFIY